MSVRSKDIIPIANMQENIKEFAFLGNYINKRICLATID